MGSFVFKDRGELSILEDRSREITKPLEKKLADLVDAEWIKRERGQDPALGQLRTSGEGPLSTWKAGVGPIHFEVETARSVGAPAL